jgi:hypothetical protein
MTARREFRLSPTTRQILTAGFAEASVTSATSMSFIAEVLDKKKKTGRKRRCGDCGLLYPQSEVRAEWDEDDRRIGWTCSNCY